MTYKENDVVTLEYKNGLIGYCINGISNNYTYNLGKSEVYLAATMYNLGDQIEIM